MTRRINNAGINLIKEFEGVRLKAYKDVGGVWTIGYGSTGSHVKPGMVITASQAENLLRDDLQRFEQIVDLKTRDVPTTDNQFAAMVSLAFNVGPGDPKRGRAGFLTSSVLKFHRAGRQAFAAAAFLLWVKVKGKTIRGLVRRRNAERRLYLS